MKHLAVIASLLGVALGAEPQSLQGDVHNPILSNDEESGLFTFLRQFVPGPRGDRLFLGTLSSLNATLIALPKSAGGRVTSQVARYVIQNYFAKRHGWRLKGLDRNGDESHSWKALHGLSVIRHKAPSLVSVLSDSALLENGFSQNEVAALVLALEMLIYDESVEVLDKAYAALNVSSAELLSLSSLRRVIQAYVAMYTHGKMEQLPPHMAASLLQLEEEAHTFDQKNPRARLSYDEWLNLKEFVEDAVQRVVSTEGLDRNFLLPVRFSYEHAWKVVELLRERFGEHQNKDCLTMKQALMDVDPTGQGRVTLKNFYLRGESLHYWFEEAPAYLMRIGAIDASQDGDPKVLVANYIKGPANCIASFSHHSVCCLLECVDVMEAIEQKVAAPSANPEELLSIVGGISTATVKAPREIHPDLEAKLFGIADNNEGLVPLHGRLFAQWLHFAFPYECTYPHVDQDLFELDHGKHEAHQLVSPEELLLVHEISSLVPGRQQWFLDAWVDHEISFLEDEPDRSFLDMIDWVERFVGTHEVAIVATLFLCGMTLMSKLRKMRRARTKADCYDDLFGDFEDSKKVWQKPRKAKDVSREAMKEASKREVPAKLNKAKPAKEQDETPNHKVSKPKRKKDGIAKKDDKMKVVHQTSSDEEKSSVVQKTSIDENHQASSDEEKLFVAQETPIDEIKTIVEKGNTAVDDSIFKSNQPESEPEEIIAANALPVRAHAGSSSSAKKTKQKKDVPVPDTLEHSHQTASLMQSKVETVGGSIPKKDVQDQARDESESCEETQRPVTDMTSCIDELCQSLPAHEANELVLPAPQILPPLGQFMPTPPGLMPSAIDVDECAVDYYHLTPAQLTNAPCDARAGDYYHLTPLASIACDTDSLRKACSPGNYTGLDKVGPPPGLEMLGPPPGVFEGSPMSVPLGRIDSSPMRIEPAYITTTATCPAEPPGLGREEALAAQVQELAIKSLQAQYEMQAREQLEFYLSGGGFFPMQQFHN